jgi:hypothetical protein
MRAKKPHPLPSPGHPAAVEPAVVDKGAFVGIKNPLMHRPPIGLAELGLRTPLGTPTIRRLGSARF